MVGTNGVDPNYFWYDMNIDEVSALFKAYGLASRMSWEQTRIIAYNSVQWGKKAPKIQKFMPFEWDNPYKREDNRTKETKKKFSDSFINAIKNGKQL